MWQWWHGGICELGEEGEGGGANFRQYSDHPQSPTQPLPSYTLSQITLLLASLVGRFNVSEERQKID